MRVSTVIILCFISSLQQIHLVDGVVIPHLNYLFETFTPYSMVRFFEFSDIGWNISEKCIKDMYLYLDGLQKDVPWAIKLYDASGYYSGNFIKGKTIRLGNSEQCNDLNYDFVKYAANLITDQLLIPFPVHNVMAKYRHNFNSDFIVDMVVDQLVCVPQSCGRNDLLQVMSPIDPVFLEPVDGMIKSSLLQIRILSKNYLPKNDLNFVIMCTIILIVMGLSLLSLLENKIFCKNKNEIHRATIILPPKHEVQQITKLNNNEENALTKLRMHPLADSMTINNINTNNHVNLVKVKKIKLENAATISLDIISGNCDYAKNKNQQSTPLTKGFVRKLLKAFSWQTNYYDLINTQSSDCCDLPVISGIRVLTALCIMFTHVCTFLSFVADNKTFKIDSSKSLPFAFVSDHGSYAIDSYFLLCGCSISFMFYNTIKNINVDRMCGIFDQLLHFSAMILYKILRFILSYIVALILLQITMKYLHDHGALEIPSQDHITCEENMWRNILYADAFFPISQRCMPWAWYISLEAHFFIIICIILLLSRNHPHYAVIICGSFFISSVISTSTIAYYSGGSKSSNLNNMERDIAEVNGIYDQPLIRIGPYLFGIGLGYIIYKTNGKIPMSFFVVMCGWLASAFLITGLIFTKFHADKLEPFVLSSFSTITHSIWSMILFWIVIASLSNHSGFIGRLLSSQIFTSTSKLVNCVLLLHPLVSRIFVLSSDTVVHLSFSIIIPYFIGLSIISFILAFFFYMMFEAPICALLKMVYHKNLK